MVADWIYGGLAEAIHKVIPQCWPLYEYRLVECGYNRGYELCMEVLTQKRMGTSWYNLDVHPEFSVGSC